MAIDYTLTRAVGTFTVTDNFDDTETCIIGGKTYTINGTVGTADGSVHLGSDAEGTLANLAAAIDLDATGGETGVEDADYASGMTINLYVRVVSVSATVLVVTAKTPGVAGNLIDTTDTHGEGAWGAALLEDGAGDLDGWATSLLALNQVNAEIAAEIRTELTLAAD